MAYTTINKPSQYFNTVLYTGTGSSRNQTGVGFDPDWVWIKSRSNAYNHNVWDRVRGAGQRLITNDTGAEETQTGDMSAFVTDGITVGAGSITNANGATFVMWNWLAANSTTSNTQGSITSTVSANTTAGFSIVSYTGTGANATVGHGLGVAPDFLIIKNRTGANSWPVWSRSYGNAGVLYLDLTNSPPDTNSVFLNGTIPTSSVFSIGTAGHVNTSSYNYIAYVFNSVKGFSKFGSWTSNGSATADNFVYTGFKPAWVMMKMSSYTSSWFIYDNKRVTYNADNNHLIANTADAQGTNTSVDFYSNGFRSNGLFNSYSGQTIIYAAFAENPFVSSTFIPTTAR